MSRISVRIVYSELSSEIRLSASGSISQLDVSVLLKISRELPYLVLKKSNSYVCDYKITIEKLD